MSLPPNAQDSVRDAEGAAFPGGLTPRYGKRLVAHSIVLHVQRCWIALKTTNAIERINKEFKRRTKSMETVGESTLEAVVAFAALRLELGWRSKPINSLSLGNLKNLKNTKEVNVIENVIEEIGLLN